MNSSVRSFSKFGSTVFAVVTAIEVFGSQLPVTASGFLPPLVSVSSFA